jgi:hypothetical protein
VDGIDDDDKLTVVKVRREIEPWRAKIEYLNLRPTPIGAAKRLYSQWSEAVIAEKDIA